MRTTNSRSLAVIGQMEKNLRGFLFCLCLVCLALTMEKTCRYLKVDVAEPMKKDNW